MTAAGLLRRLARAAGFARHIPPGQMLRRLVLAARFRAGDRGLIRRAPPTAPAPPRADGAAPSPVRPPAVPVRRDGDRFALTILGRTHVMPAGLDWAAPGAGPAQQLARMTLHYMQWTDRADAETVAIAVESWIVANGEPAPGAWRDGWNAYALSLRVVAWMDGLARHAPRPDDPVPAGALASLARQIRHLERVVETDIGGNHLVKNARALVRAGAFFSGPEAARWRRRGLSLVERVLTGQILPDGVHFERSPSYHAQVYADLLDIRQALGPDRPAALDGVLAAMAQAIADLAHPDGAIAQFNDAGLAMAESPAACLAAHAAAFGSAPSPRPAFAYPHAGYFGWRSAETCLVVDCGRIAPDALPAHGHGDLLSVEWSVGGRRVVVDPGVFEYVAGPRRAASRSAAAHNTLCFAGADQADFFGAFRVARRPSPNLIAWSADADGAAFDGSHDGFDHLPGRPRHRRRIAVAADRLTISDRIDGTPVVAATVGLLLHPDVTVETTPDGLLLGVGATRIAVTVAGAPVAVEPAVWWPDMGVEHPTRRLTIHVEPGVTQVIMTLAVLMPGTGGSA